MRGWTDGQRDQCLPKMDERTDRQLDWDCVCDKTGFECKSRSAKLSSILKSVAQFLEGQIERKTDRMWGWRIDIQMYQPPKREKDIEVCVCLSQKVLERKIEDTLLVNGEWCKKKWESWPDKNNVKGFL